MNKMKNHTFYILINFREKKGEKYEKNKDDVFPAGAARLAERLFCAFR